MDKKQLFVLTQDYVLRSGHHCLTVIGVYDVENISEAYDNRRETIFECFGELQGRCEWENKPAGDPSFGEHYYFDDGERVTLCARVYRLNHHIDY